MNHKSEPNKYAYKQIANTNKRDQQIVREMTALFGTPEKDAQEIVTAERDAEWKDRVAESLQDYEDGKFGFE